MQNYHNLNARVENEITQFYINHRVKSKMTRCTFYMKQKLLFVFCCIRCWTETEKKVYTKFDNCTRNTHRQNEE